MAQQTYQKLRELEPTNSIRNKVFNKLICIFEKHCPLLNEADRIVFSLNVERGILNFSASKSSQHKAIWDDTFRSVYASKARQILSNLDPDSYVGNTDLLNRLVNKEFTEEQLCCHMSHEDMLPELYEYYKNLMKKEYEREEKMLNVSEMPDGILQCGKCKSYKTHYTEKQTRSADEPTTKFCYCFACGHRWRFC